MDPLNFVQGYNELKFNPGDYLELEVKLDDEKCDNTITLDRNDVDKLIEWLVQWYNGGQE